MLALLLAGCAHATADREPAILGRWHRVAEANVGDPFQTLASEYIEFHPSGVLASLLFDQGPQQYWTTALGEYVISDTEHITINGKCWQGWQSYDCSKVYRFDLNGDTLAIFDAQSQERHIEYKRIGTVGPDLPPTLAPPMPSATPVAVRDYAVDVVGN